MAPKMMRAWQYNKTTGGLANNLQLNTVPLPQTTADQHLVQMQYVALNPVDYKPAEVALFSYLMIKKPATPGIDFAGRIVTPAPGSSLKPGQFVFGAAEINAFAGGALREYAASNVKGVAPAPEGMSAKDLATICVAGETAYQSILPHVKAGDKIFVSTTCGYKADHTLIVAQINGGSGGVGVFGIQIAKIAGCKVTTSCSTANVDLCKSLGADHVIDYRTENLVEALKKTGPYDHVVDNVGADWSLVWKAHEYTKPSAKLVGVGAELSLAILPRMLRLKLVPGFLGGAKRQHVGIFAEPRVSEMVEIANWMKEGKIKPMIDSEYAFEQTPEAFRKQKTGRARGKVVIEVGGENI
jgi:NADPH:quinone reductase-like Zn-dependent oxidoreductase